VLVRYRSGAEEPEQSAGAVEWVLAMGGEARSGWIEGELTEPLMKVKGVKGVDLRSLKGRALVDHDGRVNVDALLGAVKGVKGTKMGVEWFCTAEPMK
jgi:hypothetical protein